MLPSNLRIFHFDDQAFANRLASALTLIRSDVSITIEDLMKCEGVPIITEADLGVVVVGSKATSHHFTMYTDQMSYTKSFFDDVVTVADKQLEASYFSTFAPAQQPFFVDAEDPRLSPGILPVALLLAEGISGEESRLEDLQGKILLEGARGEAMDFIAAARKVLQIGQTPLGAVFEEGTESLVVRTAATDSDVQAAQGPLVGQLHQEMIGKAARFLDVAPRLDNQIGWAGVGRLAQRIYGLLDRPTHDIPDVLGYIYGATLELGSFLEMDKNINLGAISYALPLNAEMRRPLEDLIISLAPWLRAFPSIRQLDDEASKFLVTDFHLVGPSSAVVEFAKSSQAILGEDAAALIGLLEAAGRGLHHSPKAGHRGLVSVRNLIMAAAGVVSTFLLGSVASDFAGKSAVVQRVGTFLAQAEGPILDILASLPLDLRLAVEAIIRQTHDLPGVPPGEIRPRPPARRPDEPFSL